MIDIDEAGLKTKKLSETIKGMHGTYFLIERDENFAIYQKDKPASCYEVFKIKKIDAKKSAEAFSRMYGQSYDLETLPDIKEKYPKDEDFGSIAWTYNSLDKAKEKLEFLKENLIKDKENKSEQEKRKKLYEECGFEDVSK